MNKHIPSSIITKQLLLNITSKIGYWILKLELAQGKLNSNLEKLSNKEIKKYLKHIIISYEGEKIIFSVNLDNNIPTLSLNYQDNVYRIWLTETDNEVELFTDIEETVENGINFFIGLENIINGEIKQIQHELSKLELEQGVES